MRAILLFLIAVLFVEVARSQKQFLNSDADICRLLKDGTKLRKPGTCDTPIICQNSRSQVGVQCTGSTPFVDRDGNCVASVSDTYCKSPCIKSSPKFVQDKKNCNGWYQCYYETEVNRGTCGYNFYFDATTQICNYPDSVKCDPTYNLCDVVGNNIPIKDEENCDKYYICKNSISSSVVCQNQYFNIKSGGCDVKAKADCAQHLIPKEICGTAKLAIRNRFVRDLVTCRGYFFCKDLGQGIPDTKPAWGQCPLHEFFEPVESVCMKRAHVKCVEDRCDGRADGFELSPTRGCQHYLVCNANHTENVLKCDEGLYFDADRRICSTGKLSYPICE